MYCEKAHRLMKKLNRNRDTLNTYHVDLVLEILHESSALLEENLKIAEITNDRNHPDHKKSLPTVIIRHACIQRNMRCLMAYLHNRIVCLKTLRWQYGVNIPAEVKQHMTTSELTFFKDYNRMLEEYRFEVSSSADTEVNLMQDLKPPKSLYIQVRVLEDYDQFQMSDGVWLKLKKNRIHFLPRKDCLDLIKKGILEHVV